MGAREKNPTCQVHTYVFDDEWQALQFMQNLVEAVIQGHTEYNREAIYHLRDTELGKTGRGKTSAEPQQKKKLVATHEQQVDAAASQPTVDFDFPAAAL